MMRHIPDSEEPQQDQIIDLLQKVFLLHLHELGATPEMIAKTVGKEKRWVLEILNKLPEGVSSWEAMGEITKNEAELQQIQQVFKLAPDYEATWALLNEGIDSTFTVARISPEEFVRAFNGMNTWWLAIYRKYTSYLELKHRKVVAQGWPDLGDLRTLCPIVADPNNLALFQQFIEVLELIVYKSDKSPNIIWNLMRIQTNDLVIGIEGTTVKGICQMTKNGWESYKYDYRDVYNYAQTVGFPVEWIDWNPRIFGFVPTPPAKSVPGIARLVNQHHAVVNAWKKYKQTHP